jgi:M6 family metalloprotease-like protein
VFKFSSLFLVLLLAPALSSAETPASLPGVPYSFAPTSGQLKLLVLLINFPEQKPVFSKEQFAGLFFSRSTLPTGSLNDYLNEVSYQKLSVEGEVRGWYQAREAETYYAANAYGQNPDLYPHAAARLVEEAIAQAEAEGVDFSTYDNDGDGHVDGLVVIHQGTGGEITRRQEQLWTTVDYLSRDRGAPLTANGVLLDRFMLFEEYLNPEQILPLGILAHEFGHALGLPDLYQQGGRLAVDGVYDLMAAGVWGRGDVYRPFQLSAFSKARLGWLEPRLLAGPETATLAPLETHPQAARLNTPRAGEYFLLENRQKLGFDQNLPGEGLLIWHVDENVITANNAPCLGCCERHPLLALVQADGKNDLERGRNRGDSDDFFPGPKNAHPGFGSDTGTGPGRSLGADSLSWACELTGVRVSGVRQTDAAVEFQARTDDPGLLYSDSPWIIVRRVDVEEVSGNGNGRAEPGEKVRLHPVLCNQGAKAKKSVVTMSAKGLQFAEAEIKVPSLGPREEGRTEDGFLLEIPPDFGPPRALELHLTLTSHKPGDEVERTALLTIGLPEILLLTETGPGLAGVWKEALDALKEPFDLWDLTSQGAPSASQLQAYPIVIGLAKSTPDPAGAGFFTGAPEALQQYLARGGNFLLVAPGRTQALSPDFLAASLHARPGTAFGGIHRVQGREGDLISRGQNFSPQYLFSYPSLPSYAELQPGEQAAVIYTDGLEHAIGIRYPADQPAPSKAVVLAFSFEALPAAAQAQVLDRIFNFFRRPVDAPVVDSITPSAGMRGVSGCKVTLKGLNLKPQAAVDLGPGVQVDETQAPNPNTLELTLHLDPNAPVGQRDLTLTMPGQKPWVLPKAFTVIP